MPGPRKLAVAILKQAIEDAGRGCPEARKWLTVESYGLRYWCGVLELDCETVQAALERRFAQDRPVTPGEVARQALLENPELSNREIGRRYGLNYETVRYARLKLEDQAAG